MKGNDKQTQQALARYRGIIISIAIFIILIIAILGINFYSTTQINKDTASINAVSTMRDNIQAINKNLFDLSLSYGEDPFSPHISHANKVLAEARDGISEEIKTFDQGGTVKMASGSVQIEPIATPKGASAIAAMKSEWQIFKDSISNYLATANDYDSTRTPLDLAVNQAQGSGVLIYNQINRLADDISEQAERRANSLRIIQIAGITIALLYFLLFLLFFIRRLRDSDKKADAAKKETDSIMATVNEGLFLVNNDLQISDQYSAKLESIVAQKDLAGKQLGELIEPMASEKDVQAVRGFVNQLFNPRVKEKLIQDLNPLDRVSISVLNDHGEEEERHLAFNFSRVYEGKRISRVLASVSDITKAVQLEEQLAKEREQSDNQIAMLSDILNADEQILSSFIRHSKEATQNVNDILKRPDRSQADLSNKAKEIFREIHGLKGEASALKLDNFVMMTNAFEDKIVGLQGKAKLNGNDFLPLTVELEQLIEDTNKAERMLERLKGGGGLSSSDLMPKSPSSPATDNAPHSNMGASLSSHFSQYAQEIAERNGKQVSFRATGLEKLTGDHSTVDKIKDTITQLIRNAIVHGIEPSHERSEKGKRPSGIIQVQVSEPAANTLQLTVDDDGKGLHLDTIRNKAVESGLFTEAEAATLSKQQLHQLIFSSGFSTASSVGEDAGRGVGMDVIKERVKQLNGKIGILSEDDKYTRFVIRFPK